MDSALVSGYQQPSPITTTLVRFDTPGGPICMTDGGFTQFDANEGNGPEIYYGNHPTYGRLSTVSSIKDGAEAQTTRVDITLLPASDVAAAALAAPSMQGVRVQWWEGVIHRQDGLLIGYPELKFDGEIDKPRFRVGGNWALTIECGTQAERQLEPNTDWRLNNAFHQRCWPGELGMINVDGVTRKEEWRSRPPDPGLFKRLISTFVPISKMF
ncbi:hypothetical protein [Brevundimonas diminuta]|uniref:hypothetical protein n=1 Tax=Brevundimonas diminuta TaxID=293 RepID=UPI00069BF375|nr:hypothetical protein [Brevundimonas diminuta]